ncbi:hypothetical protein [Pelomicrobium methylotrophicum]|uniref:hypothetical protein n=1 Tax=Pelomicrobium methylotrophicum TaxID=2602750 RepID=UPI001969DC36|nr:hypothetical protein [Pelomicrobium methylotrophicum]
MARTLTPEEAAVMIIRRRLQQVQDGQHPRQRRETKREEQERKAGRSENSRSGR